MATFLEQIKSQFLVFYRRHKTLVEILFFILGFVIDLLAVKRIDSSFNLLQQGTYLFLLGILLVLEIKKESGNPRPSSFGEKWWKYHQLVIHFLFGSLLSLLAIFYYSSASLFTGLLFILLLSGLMLANEIKKIRAMGLPVRFILFFICTLSYFSFLFPIFLGEIGPLPFWLGVLSSLLLLLMIWFFPLKDSKRLKNQLLPISLGVHLFFIFAYYTSLIPPVPVALKKMGVYYSVEKKNGKYIGKFLPRNMFLGERKLFVRTQDKIHILLSIFSPTHFKDEITLNWYRKDEKLGRKLEDSISLKILGGRDQGHRGHGVKENYLPGEWEVVVETSDQRELGRLRFEVVKDTSLGERVFSEDEF